MGANLKQKKEETFESSLKKLESILSDLANSAISLDELVSKFAQAKGYLEFCRSRLDSAELKIKALSESGTSDFEEE